jgi:hypothetical protein
VVVYPLRGIFKFHHVILQYFIRYAESYLTSADHGLHFVAIFLIGVPEWQGLHQKKDEKVAVLPSTFHPSLI